MSVSSVWGPAEVDASVLRAQVQRERFTRGLAEVLMTKAYDEVTVADICLRVGGSRRTFYEYFDDKVDACSRPTTMPPRRRCGRRGHRSMPLRTGRRASVTG